ncbi:DNA topoisomerase 1 alpha [Trifolium repens]|nr:DNA topoisomerase 1 alpha [Trifolium repens]
MSHEFDDDDGPVTFKRSSVLKSTQSQSEMRKTASHINDGRSYRKPSDVPSSNGHNSSSQNGKLVPSAKASTSSAVESSVGISKFSSFAKTYVKSPRGSSKFSSFENKKESLLEKKIPVHVKEENDSEDEVENMPLSVRMKMNNVNAKKATPIVPKKSSENSNVDAPLSSRLSLSKAQKEQQYGSSASVKQERPSTLSVKRPLDKSDSLHFSGKKSKLSDPAQSINAKQVSVKSEAKVEEEDDNDEVPLSQRMNKLPTLVDKSSSLKKVTNVTKVNKAATPSFKKKADFKKTGNKSEQFKSTKLPPSSGDGQKKWTTLVHNGIIFPPPYKPHGIKILYKGKPVTLTPEQEEVATLYAVMRDTDYMQKQKFKENFWTDWRKMLGKNHVIQNLEDCDFTPIYDWSQIEKEKKKQMSSAEKKALREEKLKQEEEYMWAIVDGVKEKVGNFRAEPPGLFRGRGEHPKMGKVKRRITPNDVVINIGKNAPIPECPIPGESWKEIRHDNTVTWLAYWNDPINPKLFKYVFLAASSSWKGQSDKEKYEKARMLKNYIGNIRAAYTKDFSSKDITKQQIAVATYFIDKLALRAGNDKDDDEADTVGCCTLKVENVTAEGYNKLKFDFLGKDSIRYENTVEVVLPVYNAILKFQKDKRPGDELFDQLDTSILNNHLKELMPNLTAKVFRTFNASFTLDDMLNKETKDGGDVASNVLVYQNANKQVAIICNHQRSVSKSHSGQISKLSEKIDELKVVLKELKIDLDRARKGKPPLKGSGGKNKRNLSPEAIEKKIDQTNAKIEKMQRDMMTKEDLKSVALGTSRINYLDPRITVAWCKRHEVPIEKIFSKTLLEKFAWALDVDPDFRF